MVRTYYFLDNVLNIIKNCYDSKWCNCKKETEKINDKAEQ